MTIYTTNNGCLSSSVIDEMFANCATMETRDVYGKPDLLKTAKFWDALSDAWELRNRTFCDGSGMVAECRNKAARYYREYADQLEGLK